MSAKNPDPVCDRCGDSCCGCYVEEVALHSKLVALREKLLCEGWPTEDDIGAIDGALHMLEAQDAH